MVKESTDSSRLAGRPDGQDEILQQEAHGRTGIGDGDHHEMEALHPVEPKQEECRGERQCDRRVQQRYEKFVVQEAAAPLRFDPTTSAEAQKYR